MKTHAQIIEELMKRPGVKAEVELLERAMRSAKEETRPKERGRGNPPPAGRRKGS